jgi:hypothetical protein
MFPNRYTSACFWRSPQRRAQIAMGMRHVWAFLARQKIAMFIINNSKLRVFWGS